MELDGPIPTPPGAEPRQGSPDRTGAWVLGRFQLRRLVRAAPEGEVWLGRERDTRRLVVVRLALGPQEARRARRAGAALAKVHAHPGVVGFVASEPIPALPSPSGSSGGGHALVTEHLDGATLGKVLWWTRFTPPRAVAVALELCAAVRACHEAGVVVGDANPEGILVGRDLRGREVLWLTGFEGAPGPIHASPEVLAGGEPDERSDVYGLGLLLYRLIAGRWPFDGPEEVVVAAQLAAEPPPLGQQNPRLRLPAGLEAVVLRCLAKRPEERFASAAELEAALRPLATVPQRDWVPASGAEATFLSEEATLHRVEPPPSPVWWLVPVAAVLALVWWAAAT